MDTEESGAPSDPNNNNGSGSGSEKAKEAKHLETVTDHVQEGQSELNESRANEAVSALDLKQSSSLTSTSTSKKKTVRLSRDDVAFVVDQLEVTDEVAERALRHAAASLETNGNGGGDAAVDVDGSSLLEAALRHLITS